MPTKKKTTKKRKSPKIKKDIIKPKVTGVTEISAKTIKEVKELDLDTSFESGKTKFKAFITKKPVILTAGFLLVLLVGFVYQVYSSTIDKMIIGDDNNGIFRDIIDVAQKDSKLLQGEAEDRINILLLGIGGKNHPGGTLTDTNMVMTIKPSTNEAAMLSLPRDLVVKVYDDENPNYWEGRKINQLYHLGGADLVMEKMEDITGLDMQYFIILDFEGFRKVIDDLGGLEINVENGFTDYEYPDYNYGYQTISFLEGIQLMDGETALQYARSRHGNNGEGSDFARAKRQQKILEASKEKFLTPQTLANPKKSLNILDSISDHLTTNMEIWEIVKFAELAQEIQKDQIVNKVIDNTPGGLLYSKLYKQTGAYVLIPNAGEYNFSEIHIMAKNIFDFGEVAEELAKVEVQNGTHKEGLAAQIAEKLEAVNIDILQVGNALDQNKDVTTIYDFTNGEKSLTLDLLRAETSAPVIMKMDITEYYGVDENTNADEALPDFLIILGADQNESS